MPVTFPYEFRDGERMVISGAQVMENLNALATALQDSLFRPGDLKATAKQAVDPGWLRTDGAFVSQAAYPDLFAAIGHYYNSGVDPGNGTFRLPLFDSRALVAAGSRSVGLSSRSLGDVWGEESHTLTTNEMPTSVPWATTGIGGILVPIVSEGNVAPGQGSANGRWRAGAGQAFTNSQASAAVNVWIKI